MIRMMLYQRVTKLRYLYEHLYFLNDLIYKNILENRNRDDMIEENHSLFHIEMQSQSFFLRFRNFFYFFGGKSREVWGFPVRLCQESCQS